MKINCFEINQPIGTFYVGYIDYRDLLKMADVNEREYNSELEKYMGIQRKLDNKRLKDIRQFIKSSDSTFPTSIVLSISSDDIIGDYNSIEHSILIKDKEKVFHVLDGQHRLYSFVDADLDELYELPISIIIDADLETQAHIFTKINLNQTRVNKSLTYDLYEYAQADTPYKIAHNITQTLNFNKGPFYNKVKMLGKSDKIFKDQFISQAALVDRFVLYISEKPMVDTDIIKKYGFNKFTKIVEKSEKAVFQEEYLNREFEFITQVFFDYFDLISKKWPIAWGNKSYILSKTTGIDAFTKALKRYLQEHLDKKRSIVEYDNLELLINKVSLSEDQLINENYSAGGVGQSTLYRDIITCWGMK
ncbi:MAG: DGQHR domain-containing protein [Candidatus Izemoplasmatales bacterium]